MKWNKKALYSLFGIAAIGLVSAAAIAEDHHDRHEGHDCDHQKFSETDRAAAMQKRQADLHAKLGLNANQEAAWNTFVSKVVPPTEKDKPNFDELAKLTTPERLDKIQAFTQAHFNKLQEHHAAIKTFYSALTPQQQKIFDAEFLPPFGKHGAGHPDDFRPTHGENSRTQPLIHTA